MSALEPLTLDRPAVYRIEVQGRINGDLGRWMEQRTVAAGEGGCTITVIVARVIDQAELHGILQALYSLGLPLLSLARLE